MVIGATGLTGGQLIELLVADERYTVVALVRKPLPVNHEKLVQVQFEFDNPDTDLVVADEIYCCLGTTIKAAGSKAAFYKVDYEYTLTIAQAAYAHGATKYALVSAVGANKNSGIFYSRTKGAIEEAITRVGFESLFIFRPSVLLGHRATSRRGETIAKLLMKTFNFAIPKKYKAIEAVQVARAMIAAMNSGKTGVHILEADQL